MRVVIPVLVGAAIGCGDAKSDDKPAELVIAPREIGALGLVADLAAEDEIGQYTDVRGARIKFADRSRRSQGPASPGRAAPPEAVRSTFDAKTHGVLLTERPADEADTLDAAKRRIERFLGDEPGDEVEFTRATKNDLGWHVEYRQTRPVSAQVGVSIGKTINGARWHCHGFTYDPSQLPSLREACRSLRAK